MYRWGIDLRGPFHTTARGSMYVMVMIEHFSKWLIVIPLPTKSGECTAAPFAMVLGFYSAPAQIITDQGTEFDGAFQQVGHAGHIEHRRTSPSHLQADGVAERAVQTVKRSLRRLITAQPNRQCVWDSLLPSFMLAYNTTRQESTGLRRVS